MMATPLRLDTDRRSDGTTVLTAVGEVDLSNVTEFSDAISDAVRAGTGSVRVDLSSVDYLDSGAISVLFTHAEAIDIVANPILMSVLTLSGLVEVTSVTPAPAGSAG
jgi:anti-anti-sigma factor